MGSVQNGGKCRVERQTTRILPPKGTIAQIWRNIHGPVKRSKLDRVYYIFVGGDDIFDWPFQTADSWQTSKSKTCLPWFALMMETPPNRLTYPKNSPKSPWFFGIPDSDSKPWDMGENSLTKMDSWWEFPWFFHGFYQEFHGIFQGSGFFFPPRRRRPEKPAGNPPPEWPDS